MAASFGQFLPTVFICNAHRTNATKFHATYSASEGKGSEGYVQEVQFYGRAMETDERESTDCVAAVDGVAFTAVAL